jgi:hypothetical protein
MTGQPIKIDGAFRMTFSGYLMRLAVMLMAVAPAYAAPAAVLSLTPAHACQPPAGSPGKLLDLAYPNASTGGNAPFDHQVDINGDGWCDWVSTAAQPPHRDGVELMQPQMKDFIFLGGPRGWRRFGNAKAIRAFIDQHDVDRPVPYDGGAEVSGFVSPLFIFADGEPRPYVAALALAQDVLDARAEDVVVYRWHDGFDALLRVGEQERAMVIRFLQAHYCGSKAVLPVQSVAEAVCAR